MIEYVCVCVCVCRYIYVCVCVYIYSNSFPNLEPVRCSMSSPNSCFLTWIEISQETGKLVWYSHLLKNFLQFVVIHTLKGFSVVNEAEVDVFFWNSLAFSMIQQMLQFDLWFLFLKRAPPSSAAKSIINLISVFTVWWCPCLKSSLVLLHIITLLI